MATQEDRISRLEGACEQVDRSLTSRHESINRLRAEMHESNAELLLEMNSKLNVLIGVVLGSWVTMMTAIVISFFVSN